MKLLSPIPQLTAPSLQDTVDFYVSVLDFTCNTLDEEWKIACIKKDDVTVELVHPQARFPYNGGEPFNAPVFTSGIYIHLEEGKEIDELWEKVKDKAEVCFPVQDFDYGMREFGIYDNNGYLLQFGQEISA
ncbi:bleomycin resistance family protein [Chitinophaga alhagiae]|uniref:Bleomycin resistance family protein n=1 Tax=Chitinophaga alhagiae TaxID=2203219 RepID=A0ABN5LRN7_9BACT|nr:VOC family protein [Chitinophaga alhagiae]AWO00298.1 bleomycin resistance family protein [Chitinophaga alhagiae]